MRSRCGRRAFRAYPILCVKALSFVLVDNMRTKVASPLDDKG
ncbi:hypothetical protein [Bathymodiolus japonicus methanotrophic gill symbiont]|nr:hypothetical protein [Bathymodiolus japonicus methanotrophic gill symbiont]